MAPSVGPMHGVHATAKAAPATTGPPLPARCMRPPTWNSRFSRSTNGVSRKKSPSAVMTTAETFSSRARCSFSDAPSAVAESPSTTKIAEKASTNITAGSRTRRGPAVLTSAGGTPGTVERWPGTSGRTHGDRNDTRPANAAARSPTPPPPSHSTASRLASGLMSLSVEIGLGLALLTALASVVGFLYKARGAVAAPPVEWSKPLRSSIALFSSGWYTIGILVAMGGWGLHVAALSLAPISLVQSTIAGGLVLLTVVADRVFGYEVSRREWIGVALTAVGLSFLAATLEHGAGGAHSDYTPATLAAFVGGLTVVAVIAWRVARPG